MELSGSVQAEPIVFHPENQRVSFSSRCFIQVRDKPTHLLKYFFHLVALISAFCVPRHRKLRLTRTMEAEFFIVRRKKARDVFLAIFSSSSQEEDCTQMEVFTTISCSFFCLSVSSIGGLSVGKKSP